MNGFIKTLRVGFAVIFWSWNAMFLLLVTAGFAPLVVFDLIADAMEGLARWSTVGWATVLFFLPVVVTVAAGMRLRKEPLALFVAFFGIEIPGLSLSLIRLFGFSDLHGAAGISLASVVVGGVALLAFIARPPSLGVLPRALIHAGLAVFAVGSLYVGFVLSFFTVPVFFGSLWEVLRSIFREPLMIFAVFIPALWAGTTFLSVLLSPIFTPIAAVRALVRSHRALAATVAGARGAFALGLVPAALIVVVIASGWQQPHTPAFARLAKAPATDAERRAIVADEASIREGLVDAYLAAHRYPADNGSDELDDAWHEIGLDADEEMTALHHALARPFVFDGDAGPAKARADELYRAVFGEEIERTEREAVREALAANASRDQRYAGFMNEGEERVWLAAQKVTVDEKEGWASVEIEDTWMNQTGNDEEVLLMFSLPPDAAVTGLWLGADPDKAKAFTHVVAPRGAAQQVYNEQVRARRDPALLEQVGPQQYRLRVFPVPRRQRQYGRMMNTYDAWHDVDAARPRMHVWLRYETILRPDGSVPFPRLAERRNGFWDSSTTRTVDGHDVDAGVDEQWVQSPSTVPKGQPPTTLRGVAGDTCYELAPAAPPLRGSLAGKTIDVVIDRSFEMRLHTLALKDAQRALAETGATLRYVLTAGAFRGEPAIVADALDVDALVPFASTSPREMLTQYAQLRGAGSAPAAVVVLAARGSFDVAVDGPLAVPLDAPLFLVHLSSPTDPSSGGLPAGYDDATADALAKSGGTAVDGRDLVDVLSALEGGALVVAGRSFAPAPTGAGACAGGPPGVIARLAIRDLDRSRRRDDPTTLDALHRIAVGASVVTPYSSMIVLVDEAQRKRLEELEQQSDRFDREVEQHKETTPSVVGVPEPHEWALLAVVVVFAFITLRRMRAAQLPASPA